MTRPAGTASPEFVLIKDAQPAGIFPSGLEYNAPARGMWNIVHTGMLVPEAQEIFACAQGCLRGVILTAAEMLELERMSWISVSENDMFDGSLESDIVEGVKDIITKLGRKPPVVLLYLSCIHLFAGADFQAILEELRREYPDIYFVDCYMTPTMRTTVSPVMKMSAQIYGALEKRELDPRAVGIVGNDRPTDEESELVRIIKDGGFELRDITRCRSFEEYKTLSECSINISYIPTGVLAGQELEERFGAKHLHLPARYDFEGIEENYRVLCKTLGIDMPDLSGDRAAAEEALQKAREVIGDMPICVDFTLVTRPFELAWLLVRQGFNVRHIIADSAAGEEEAFEGLKQAVPDLRIYCHTNVNMMEMPEREHERVLALGQKGAHYFATDNFVNFVVNGGYYGYVGIRKIAELMTDAYNVPKDRAEVLRLKGYGCASCLVD